MTCPLCGECPTFSKERDRGRVYGVEYACECTTEWATATRSIGSQTQLERIKDRVRARYSRTLVAEVVREYQLQDICEIDLDWEE